MPRPLPTRAARFHFVDGLRGVGSIAVLLGHLMGVAKQLRGELDLPPSLAAKALVYVGDGAVEMFFVLSGFVIAYSIRDVRLTAANTARFVLRRQIRLDPVYWMSLLIAVLDLTFLHPQSGPPATLANVAVNALYLPWILKRRVLLQLSWTLCLEFQFYLLFILLAGLAQGLARRGHRLWGALLVVGFAAASLGIRLSQQEPDHVLFPSLWFLFGAGAVTQWTLSGLCPRWLGGGFLAALGLAAAITLDRGLLVAAATAGSLYLAGRTQHLEDWLSQRPVRFLGRISYSLYLVHVLFITWVLELGQRVTGLTGAWTWVWASAAFIGAILAAQLVNRGVEQPAIRWASRFRQGAGIATNRESESAESEAA